MFYLTMSSTHFYLRLYGVRHMVKDHSDGERGNRSFFRLEARVLLYARPLLHQLWSTGWKEK